MLSSLTIKDFKIFPNQEVKFDNFTKINYLIGENGSGKSSLMEAIKIIHEHDFYSDERGKGLKSHNIRDYFGENTTILRPYFRANLKYKKSDQHDETYIDVFRHNDNRLGISHISGPDLHGFPGSAGRCWYLSTHSSSTESNKMQSIMNSLKYDLGGLNEEDGQEIKEVLNKIFKANKLNRRVKFVHGTLSNPSSVMLKIKDCGQTYTLPLASIGSGYLSLITYYLALNQFIHKQENKIDLHKAFNIICLEEPEHSLHPKFQKLFPTILQEILDNPENIGYELQFFVSTHSPFIIANATDEHKIYFFKNENGKASINDVKNDINNRYKLFTLLGGEKNDLGYPKNFVILEESSIQCLLQNLQEKEIIDTEVQFISASGYGNIDNLVKNIKSIDTLLKCNPFYSDTYRIITDNFKNFNDSEAQKLNELKKKLGERFIELEKKELEEYYPPELKKKYDSKKKELDKKDEYNQIGIIKRESALKFAETIKTEEEFSRIFNNQLDFLINFKNGADK